ncbi:MAG: cobalamin biosynthesis protein CobW [Pseudomonadota bacterium]
MNERVPVTIVTGFLGAGKTTLIKHLLDKANGARIGLIINEFGDLGFDGDQVSACLDPGCEDDVVELTNGCLCCTVADDFVPALEALLNRPLPPERIVIETSGLALPQPLIAAFAWPTVKPRVTVDGVVTLVDAPAVAAGRFAHDPEAVDAARRADEALDHESPLQELFEDQLKAADLVLMSKTDGVDEATLSDVETTVRAAIRPGVAVVSGTDPMIFGLGAAAESDPAARDGHHGHDADHEHDDFDTVILHKRYGSRAEAEAALNALAADPAILRLKGSVTLGDKTAPLFVQAVGPRLETWFGRPGQPAGGLVVIGLSPLNHARLNESGDAVAA